jgi:hypothetical protein
MACPRWNETALCASIPEEKSLPVSGLVQIHPRLQIVNTLRWEATVFSNALDFFGHIRAQYQPQQTVTSCLTDLWPERKLRE